MLFYMKILPFSQSPNRGSVNELKRNLEGEAG